MDQLILASLRRLRRPFRAAPSAPAVADSVAAAADGVGHFVCPFCYPNPRVPAASFCGSLRAPRLVEVSGEHLTKCPLCWAVFERGGWCEHYAKPGMSGRP